MSINASASRSSLRDGTSQFLSALDVDKSAISELTSSPTMHADRTKPVVPNKIPLHFTVWYMPIRLRVDVLFRESKVDHVDSLFVWRYSDDAVSQLDIAMEDPPAVHEF